MTTQPHAVAVIGAGVAGLSCARRLRAAGLGVTIYDKGRKAGGRCATRRSGDFAFDHGAQYLTVSEAQFRATVEEAEAWGALEAWAEQPKRLCSERGEPPPPHTLRWVGRPGMSAFASHLARGLDVWTQTRIEAIERRGDGWHLLMADGSVAKGFDTVIVAVPAPQAAPLLAAAPDLAKRAQEARYAPCWALMVGYRAPSVHFASAASIDRHPLAWICADHRKAGRAAMDRAEAWVVHASPAWSRMHLESAPEEAARLLLSMFIDLVDGDVPEPDALAAHRWRFARVEAAVGEPCLYDRGVGLGACGDWCLGPRIEAASLSGAAMAERVLAGI